MGLIRTVLQLYMLVVFADAVLSYFPQVRGNEIVRRVRKLADFSLNPVRRALPDDLPFDISPIVVIVLINLFIGLW